MRVRACTKTFEGRQVLSVPDIPLTLGKIYALAGANGSGKSTFARRLGFCNLLILDEPTAAMDRESAILAEGLIDSHRWKTGCTVLLITHDLQQARRLADEARFFWRGQLWEQGTAKRVLCTPEREETRQFLTFYGGSTSSAGQPGKS